jgi:hypothetical protein
VTNDPYEQLTDLAATAVERAADYAEVWKKAIERNATGSYAGGDLFTDIHTTIGMAMDDAAKVASAVLSALAQPKPET